jgi:hypothetical protein
LIELEERGTRLQALRPGMGKILQDLAASGRVAEEPAHAILAWLSALPSRHPFRRTAVALWSVALCNALDLTPNAVARF